MRYWLRMDPDGMDDEEFHTRAGEAIWMEERFFAMLKVAVNRGFVGEE